RRSGRSRATASVLAPSIQACTAVMVGTWKSRTSCFSRAVRRPATLCRAWISTRNSSGGEETAPSGAARTATGATSPSGGRRLPARGPGGTGAVVGQAGCGRQEGKRPGAGDAQRDRVLLRTPATPVVQDVDFPFVPRRQGLIHACQ